MEWAQQLLGRSGIGLDGPAPLNPSVLHAWAEMQHLELEPYEVEALLVLDQVMRYPEPETEDVQEQAEIVKQRNAWPTPKPGVQPQLALKQAEG